MQTPHADRWEHVRIATCALVSALRPSGMPVEAIIVQVKQIAVDAGLPTSHYAGFSNESVLNLPVRMDDVVRWCIEHYYAAGSHAQPS